ncbi:MAG: response regulator [Planctomycetes bacterium]|nr:response regulator [Planctomycetota bacterium]
MKFIIIDDNQDDRILAIHELKKSFPDAEFLEIVERKDFHESVNRWDFDVVITDLSNPWLNGLEVCRQIRSIDLYLPVIMLTGTGSEEFAVTAMKSGLNDYIIKRNLCSLPAAVTESIEKARLQKEYDKAILRLRASEERFNAFMDKNPTLFFMKDADWRYVYGNESFLRFFKATRKEILGKTDFDLMPADIAKKIRENDTKVLSARTSMELREDIPCVNGIPRYWLVFKFPFEESSGQIYLGGVAIDTTLRILSEMRQTMQFNLTLALSESATLLEAASKLLQTICEGFGWDAGELWLIDTDTGVLKLKDAWHVSSADIAEFEAVSRTFTFSKGMGLPGRVWENGKPLWIADVVTDSNFPRAGIATKYGMHGAMSFPITQRNEVIGVMGFFTRYIRQPDDGIFNLMADIGIRIGSFIDKRLTEKSLQERTYLATLQADVGFALVQGGTLRDKLQRCCEAFVKNLEAALARIWIFNDEERVLELQGSAGMYTHIDGHHSKIPFGEYKIGWIARERRPHITNMVVGDTMMHDQEWTNREGIVSFAGYPLLVEDRLAGVMAIFAKKELSEITLKSLASVSDVIAIGIDRKRTEEEKSKLREQLYHSQKLESVGTLAGGIAHDFNNILMAITGYSSLLQGEVKENAIAYDFAERILKSAEKAANLTQGLLAFSRKQPSNPKPLDVNKLIGHVGDILSRLIREDIKLSIQLTDKKCVVIADSGQLDQVLMNLSTNARDAMPNGGRLGISTNRVEMDAAFIRTHGFGKAGKYSLITVSDTGIGMDEKTRQRIFEPFFTTKEVGKGTGLGLAIVYGIIKQHNGYINVKSEAGKGTTFGIYLPLIEQEAAELGKESQILPKGGSETVLVAEDNEEVRRLIKVVLEGGGYKVIESVDGADALEKFKQNRDIVQLLVLDVIMPVKNGGEVCEAVKAINPAMKILLMSGYGENVIREPLFEKGVQFISKPLSPIGLLGKVREILDA